MDNMENIGGIYEEAENEEENKIVEIPKKKSLPFYIWNVGGYDYKLRLKASGVLVLENKYKRNMMDVLTEGNIPPLAVMLTVIQVAMEPWNHGIRYTDVQKIYDKWEEEGGSQMDLYSEVITPLMAVSGFFTKEMAEEILKKMNR